ncbi:MAG: hypothetical protein SVR94_05055 [Pseudomonadota bacterium]|nr:hypothetical protein [Pseudomonadota bacterium]
MITRYVFWIQSFACFLILFITLIQASYAISFSVDKDSVGTPPLVPDIAPPPVYNQIFFAEIHVSLDTLDAVLLLDEDENVNALSNSLNLDLDQGLIFSVDNNTMGLTNTVIHQRMPAGSDLFYAPLRGGHFLYRLAARHNLRNRRDNLNALERFNNISDSFANMKTPIYFSVSGQASIEMIDTHAESSRKIFKAAVEMGLELGDDIDALVVATEQALFSLAPESPSLDKIPPATQPPYSAADIFLTTFTGDYQRVHTAEALGLLIGDNIDALALIPESQVKAGFHANAKIKENKIILTWQIPLAQPKAQFKIWRTVLPEHKKCQEIELENYTVNELELEQDSASSLFTYEDKQVQVEQTYCYLLQWHKDETISPEQWASVISITFKPE